MSKFLGIFTTGNLLQTLLCSCLLFLNFNLEVAASLSCNRKCGADLVSFDYCLLPQALSHPYATNLSGNNFYDQNQYENNYQFCPIMASPGAPDFNVYFQSPEPGLFEFQTFSSLDTIMIIIDCRTGAVLSCDDDSGIDYNSLIRFKLLQGVPYRVVVDGFSYQQRGPLQLQVAEIPWPNPSECAPIDTISYVFPSHMNSAVRLHSGKISSIDPVSITNTTSCTNTSDTRINQASEIVGVIAETTGNYTFLVCGTDDDSEGDIDDDRWAFSLSYQVCNDSMSCFQTSAYESVPLGKGDHLSLAVSGREGFYNLFSFMNQGASNHTWCSVCLESLTTQQGSSYYSMEEFNYPESNLTFTGQAFFMFTDSSQLSRFVVCGAVNARFYVQDCFQNTIASGATYGIAPPYLEFNATKDQLYVFIIEGLTENDEGEFSISNGFTGSSLCSREYYGEDFQYYSLNFCYQTEKMTYLIVFLVFLSLALINIYVIWRLKSQDQVWKSAVFSSFLFSLFGILAPLHYLVACGSGFDSTRNFLIYWVSWSCISSSFVLYHLSLYDWPNYFGESTFYRNDEISLKGRLLTSIFNLCVFFGLAVASFVLLNDYDSYFSLFSFCAVEGGVCTDLIPGTIIQQLYSTATYEIDSHDEIIAQSFVSKFEYSIFRGDNSSSSYPCTYVPQLVNQTLCSNACFNQNETNPTNGICEDRTRCDFGTDCNDCGVRTQISKRRLVRCGKSTSLISFWISDSLDSTFLPLLYSSLALAGAATFIWVFCSGTYEFDDEKSSIGISEGDEDPDDVTAATAAADQNQHAQVNVHPQAQEDAADQNITVHLDQSEIV